MTPQIDGYFSYFLDYCVSRGPSPCKIVMNTYPSTFLFSIIIFSLLECAVSYSQLVKFGVSSSSWKLFKININSEKFGTSHK